jgi:uncharacterized protein
MHVDSIWMHPVKSMIGFTVSTAEIARRGVVGDRGWAVRDEVLGGIRGAKRLGGLMRFSARYTGELGGPVEITCPDGSQTGSASPDVNERLSEALDHQVTLWPLMPEDQLEHYRRGPAASDDMMAELRSVFGRTEDEPLPDFSIFPPWIMEFESEPGTYLDAFPLMVMTTSALRSLAGAIPDSNVDVRRFRPNFVVDTGDEPGHPEFGWAGKRARIGSALIEFTAPCPRCVMVTREISADIPGDRGVLRHIVRDLDQNVGTYATVIEPGTFAVGDTLTLV